MITVIFIAWFAVSIAVGLTVGRAIRIADSRRPVRGCPAGGAHREELEEEEAHDR